MNSIKKVLMIILVVVLFVVCSNDYGRQSNDNKFMFTDNYGSKYDDNKFISGDENVCSSKNTSNKISNDSRTLTFSAGELNGLYQLAEADITEEC